MWVFTNKAAVSIVQDFEDKDRGGKPLYFWVRSRTRGQIDAFCAPLNRPIKVSVTPKNDYAYRTKITLDDLETITLATVRSIDYTNFKDSIKDHKFHNACSKVWRALVDACGTGCYAPRRPRKNGQDELPWL